MTSFPPPEPKRTFLSTGTFLVESQESSDAATARDDSLEALALSHPFTRQLDIVFPSDSPSACELEDVLKQLMTTYHRVRVGLAEFASHAGAHVQKYSLESDLIAIGSSSGESLMDPDAVWCLDTRGIITILVSRNTYQRLGLVGQPLPWREHEDTYIIQISLRPQASSESDRRAHVLPFRSEVKAALEKWDMRRGASSWEVAYRCPSEDIELNRRAEAYPVQPVIRTLNQYQVPEATLRRCQGNEEQKKEWEDEVGALLEWVGMACLGSQRLQANDRPDPYVAVYSPPSPSRVADVKHVRWTGLLPPSFVKEVIASCRSAKFVSITANAVVRSPVTYVSSSPHKSFLRAPREESEDVWTLLMRTTADNNDGIWLLAESVGKWDARWG